ncbi:MAG: hypothetical protein V3W20_07785 [Candidatus Neomarinimicrobiota bacterium]
MVVFAANITEDTVNLIESVLKSDTFVRFSLQNKLNLSDKTVLIRLALINLIKHVPTNEEVSIYKAALLRPQEFDDYLKQYLEGDESVT